MKKFIPCVLVFILIASLGVFFGYLFLAKQNLSGANLTLFLAMGVFFVILNTCLIVFSFLYIRRKKFEINESFDFFISKMIDNAGTGIILFDKNHEIIWVSNFIEKKLDKNLIGKNIFLISESFKTALEKGQEKFSFSLRDQFYECQINLKHLVITVKDVTKEFLLLKEYEDEKLVIGELEIDNYQEYQTNLPQEDLFRIQTEVLKSLEALASGYNLDYRQYTNGKYVIFLNNKTLNELKAIKFSFLQTLREVQVRKGAYMSISIGFGVGTIVQNELATLAKEALLQSQARGGDQVCINTLNKKPIYFGSELEATQIVSKVKIKQMSYLLENRLNDRKVEKVVVYGHSNADLDAVGAAIGVVAIAKTFKKEVFIQNTTFDETTKEAIKQNFLVKETKNLFITPKQAQKITQKDNVLSVIVDTSDLKRIENSLLLESYGYKKDNKDVFIFDHHRILALPQGISNENIYIDTTASSACEIVVELIQFFRKNIRLGKSEAQMLLSGIYLDTMQFQKATSSRTFQASSFLETKGAQSAVSANILKISETSIKIINEITSNVHEVKPGFFLSTYDGKVEPDVIPKAADEILRVSGRKAAFVIAKLAESNLYKLSARGIDTNVQVIAESVGGGGHFSSAAATSREKLDVFRDNVIQSIIERGK